MTLLVARDIAVMLIFLALLLASMYAIRATRR